MKKVLFVVKYPLVSEYSIKPKFDGQFEATKKLGYDVFHTAYDDKHLYVIHDEEKKVIRKITLNALPGYIHWGAYVDLYKAVTKYLDIEEFDIVYFRRSPVNIDGLKMFKKMSEKGMSVISEIPTYPIDKERKTSLRRRLYGIIEMYTDYIEKRASKYYSLYAVIGEHVENLNGVKAVNIENGIMLDKIPTVKKKTDGKFHFLALASMSNWHGYDRLIQAVYELPDELKNNVIVDMVGEGGDGSLEKWRKLADVLGINKQIVFHGYKTGEDLNAIFDTANVGVGSLATFRKDITTYSCLKVREYLARGIPVIYAGDEGSLINCEFCYRVSNDDEPIDLMLYLKYYDLKKLTDISPLSIRDCVKNDYTWERQLGKVFQALEGSK